MIRFICPSCWSEHELGDSFAGSMVQCPDCHATTMAPADRLPVRRKAASWLDTTASEDDIDDIPPKRTRPPLPEPDPDNEPVKRRRGASEEVFLDAEGIHVTSSRVKTRHNTFFVRKLNSVSLRNTSKSTKLTLISVGCCLILLGFASLIQPLLSGHNQTNREKQFAAMNPHAAEARQQIAEWDGWLAWVSCSLFGAAAIVYGLVRPTYYQVSAPGQKVFATTNFELAVRLRKAIEKAIAAQL
jgi:hypothetical protein